MDVKISIPKEEVPRLCLLSALDGDRIKSFST